LAECDKVEKKREKKRFIRLENEIKRETEKTLAELFFSFRPLVSAFLHFVEMIQNNKK